MAVGVGAVPRRERSVCWRGSDPAHHAVGLRAGDGGARGGRGGGQGLRLSWWRLDVLLEMLLLHAESLYGSSAQLWLAAFIVMADGSMNREQYKATAHAHRETRARFSFGIGLCEGALGGKPVENKGQGEV